MLFGAIAANVFADDSLKKTSDNPFENIGDVDDHRFTPPGYSDKLRIYPGHWMVNNFFLRDRIIILNKLNFFYMISCVVS